MRPAGASSPSTCSRCRRVVDTARAHVRAMERGTPGEAYVVAGHPMTLVEALSTPEALTGVPAPRAVWPAWFRGASRVAGLVGRVVDLPPEYRAESLRVLGGVTYLGDDARARQELGLTHRPFESGVAETLAALADVVGVDVAVESGG